MTQTPQRIALLAGATGLVGAELLNLLLADDRYSAVHCVGRRAPALKHRKLTVHVIDLTGPGAVAKLASLPTVSDVYCTLGTTIKVAGSQEAFKAVDLDAVVAVAQAAMRSAKQAGKASGASPSAPQPMRLGVVSAMGADAKSGVFYNRIKGDMEAAVAQLGFDSVSIARPSMLAGDRASLKQTSRPAEQIGLVLMRAASFLIPANYQAIEATDVAAALHRMVTEGKAGVRIAMSGELAKMARGGG